MTPLELEVLIHCNVSMGPFYRPSLASAEAEVMLTGLGMIEPYGIDPRVSRITPKGRYWIDAVLSTPLPVESYEIPDDSQRKRAPISLAESSYPEDAIPDIEEVRDLLAKVLGIFTKHVISTKKTGYKESARS